MRRSSRCEDMKNYFHFPVQVGEPRGVIDTLHGTLHMARHCSNCGDVITCTKLQSYLSILHSICISAATTAAAAAAAAATATATAAAATAATATATATAAAATTTTTATLATPPVVMSAVCSPPLHQSFHAISLHLSSPFPSHVPSIFDHSSPCSF